MTLNYQNLFNLVLIVLAVFYCVEGTSMKEITSNHINPPYNQHKLATCPIGYTGNKCFTHSYPVMNGVDCVTYHFNSNLTISSVFGTPSHTSIYKEYTFLFKTEQNKKYFESQPEVYIPQYGGFCAWAVSGETDLTVHPWAADCLGPSGDPSIYEIINNKLYFFRYETAKLNFLSNITQYIQAGDARWRGWFGKNSSGYFDTKCTGSLR